MGEEPESVTVLRLKLELADKEAKTEREGSESEQGTRTQVANRMGKIAVQVQLNPSSGQETIRFVRADVCHMLPKMNGDDDVLTFFHTSETAMNLNPAAKDRLAEISSRSVEFKIYFNLVNYLLP